jgi:hypothetical protein
MFGSSPGNLYSEAENCYLGALDCHILVDFAGNLPLGTL